MFDSVQLFGVFGWVLGITGTSLLTRISEAIIKMFHSQNQGVEVTGRTIITLTSVGYVAIIAFAGGWLVAFSLFATEHPVIANVFSHVIIGIAAIAATAVGVAAKILLQRTG